MKLPWHAVALLSLLFGFDTAATGSHTGTHSGDRSAIGQAGVAASVARTVTIEMSDAMRFVPNRVRVRPGETIRFMVKNVGTHEA